MNEWNIQWKCKIPGEPFNPATVRLLTMLDGSKYSTSLIFLFSNKPKYVKLCIIFVGITKWWMNLEEKRLFCCGSIRLVLGYALAICVCGDENGFSCSFIQYKEKREFHLAHALYEANECFRLSTVHASRRYAALYSSTQVYLMPTRNYRRWGRSGQWWGRYIETTQSKAVEFTVFPLSGKCICRWPHRYFSFACNNMKFQTE